MKRIFFLFFPFLGLPCFGQHTFSLIVENFTKQDRKNAPVVIALKDFYQETISALVLKEDGSEVPCQLDDLDKDGVLDELCFLADVKGKAKEKFTVKLLNEGSPKDYPRRTYAEMLLRNRNLKKGGRENMYITELTVLPGYDAYHAVLHHGVAFESDLVAFRIYLDERQTIDAYGKQNQGLEIEQTQFYTSKEQKEQGFGDDVLWVGNTFGLGALRGWNGSEPTMISDVKERKQEVVAFGPVRTIVRLVDFAWRQKPTDRPVTMTTTYTLYAGHRDFSCDVSFSRKVSDFQFSTGVINVKNSTEFSDNHGLRGCWGSDWPVSLKDSAGHKVETVGLAVCVPEKHIISEQPANKDNYAFVLGTKTDRLHYDIIFASGNENFGFKDKEAWFRHLKRWKEELLNPLVVKRP